MKKILVTGALGQIGTELVFKLQEVYGYDNVIASSRSKKPDHPLNGKCIFELVDCVHIDQIRDTVKKNQIDVIYHMASILSAVGEKNPQNLWDVNMNGLYYILEVAREFNCAVFVPSSIAAFGPNTPRNNTPQDTIQRPNTIYGVSKVAGELLCDYYYHKYKLDVRGLRYPGIISNVTPPGGGTTDYAVEIYYDAVLKGKYTCFLKEDTQLDMMYMPDAVDSSIDLMEADPAKLIHRNAFNVTAMSASPKDFYLAIKKHIVDFEMDYDIDNAKQAIADSWPNAMDDSDARKEWGWDPKFDLDAMTVDMLQTLKKRFNK